MLIIKLSLTSLVVLMTIVNNGNGESNKCLTTEPRAPRKSLIQNDSQVPLIFEMTESVTQRILSWIMSIYFEEILGYNNITMGELYPQFDYEQVLDHVYDTVNVTINMELWVPFHDRDVYDLIEEKMVVVPHTTSIGRIGWFLPNQFSKYNQWNVYSDSTFAAPFRLNEDQLSIVKQHTISRELAIPECNDCNGSVETLGTYIPERCGNDTIDAPKCTVMLTSDFQMDRVITQIEEMELYVKVVCVGDNIKTVTDMLLESLSSTNPGIFIIRHWTPSDIIPTGGELPNLELPHCGGNVTSLSCEAELFSLNTIVAKKFESLSPLLFKNLKSAGISQIKYSDLINEYNENPSTTKDYDVACNWLKKNLDETKSWREESRQRLLIGGLMPVLQDRKTVDIHKILFEAMKNFNSMEDYSLDLWILDAPGSARSVANAIDHFRSRSSTLIGFVGGVSSEGINTMEGILKVHKFVVITPAVEGGDFDDRERYPYFFRTIGSNEQHKFVLSKFFQHFKWARVATITDEDEFSTQYVANMQTLFHDNNISFVNNLKIPGNEKFEEINKHLSNLIEQKARIIIVEMGLDMIQLVICAASRLEMTANQGYVWFLPGALPDNWWKFNDIDKINNSLCTPDDLYRTIRGHFSIAPVYFGPDNQLMQENITIGEWMTTYKPTGYLDNLAGFFYDAVWVYVYALKRFYDENANAVDILHTSGTQRFMEIIGETDFYGLSGRVRFNGGSSRIVDLNVRQFINDTHHVIGNFYPDTPGVGNRVTGGNLTLDPSAIVWPSNSIPVDGYEPPVPCVFESLAKSLDVSCEIAILIVSIMVSGVLITVMLICFFFVKRRYDEKVRIQQEFIRSQGRSRSKSCELDEWEIPRDKVVINRKIGEGAFGMVYGGEALFPGEGWLAVAVKTLKADSSEDERTDFLEEVELMKKFDHENVVKLLGVCIKAGPILTIMEFMLYGDLKTYLLARRHLVKESDHEGSDEISNKRLTAMALDVARALSYLAHLKYVHRDLASRNCLINAQKVVKLADFGMTRSIYESDYYRFSRKGMLPIRWMAPESLGLGLFTSASDVWSYGVLLYEIITFGSFPYQGLDNNEVLTYVKSGNCLSIPTGVKPTLKNLMTSCWNAERTERPTASEIVNTLGGNLRLIEPCLDVPLLSVRSEFSEEFGFGQTEGDRKRTSLPWPCPALVPNELAVNPQDSLLANTSEFLKMNENYGESFIIPVSNSHSGTSHIDTTPRSNSHNSVSSDSGIPNIGEREIVLQSNDHHSSGE